jgi:hypothetical protein
VSDEDKAKLTSTSSLVSALPSRALVTTIPTENPRTATAPPSSQPLRNAFTYQPTSPESGPRFLSTSTVETQKSPALTTASVGGGLGEARGLQVANNIRVNSVLSTKSSAKRQNTIEARNRLVAMGQELSRQDTTSLGNGIRKDAVGGGLEPVMEAQPQSPEHIRSLEQYRTLVRQLQEENARLTTELETLRSKHSDLQNEDIQNQEELITTYETISSLSNDKQSLEDLVSSKEKYIEKLMEKIRKITGKNEVYVTEQDIEDNGLEYDPLAMSALSSLVNKYDESDTSRLQMISQLSDVLKDIPNEDLDWDEFSDILNVKK